VSGKKRKAPVRPVLFLLIVVALLGAVDLGLYFYSLRGRAEIEKDAVLFDILTAGLGLSDLCIATEARYTRHPAASDPVAPFMDHPGAIEHFPTGSFWTPPYGKDFRPYGYR
jgi:hypothetical protein